MWSCSSRRAHRADDLFEVALALPRVLQHHRLDLGVPLRVQHREREVFELPLDVLHAEAVRERRVDVERLLRDALLLRLRERGDRAHVVQPVGELDEQDAHVLRHRDEHLAHRRGLLLFLRVELEAVELGDAVDDRGDVGAEPSLQIVEGDGGVLDRVVQQRAGERDVVETEIGEDHRDAERVGDVRVAGPAHLVAVRVARDLVRVLDEVGLALVVAAAYRFEQRPQRAVDVRSTRVPARRRARHTSPRLLMRHPGYS